jgi:hypothetical protein
MQDNNALILLSLDNLDTVTGGYYDPSGPAQPDPRVPADPPHQPQDTLGSRLGQLVSHLPSWFPTLRR